MTTALITLYVLGMIMAADFIYEIEGFDPITGNRILSCITVLFWPPCVVIGTIFSIYDWFKGR